MALPLPPPLPLLVARPLVDELFFFAASLRCHVISAKLRKFPEEGGGDFLLPHISAKKIPFLGVFSVTRHFFQLTWSLGEFLKITHVSVMGSSGPFSLFFLVSARIQFLNHVGSNKYLKIKD